MRPAGALLPLAAAAAALLCALCPTADGHGGKYRLKPRAFSPQQGLNHYCWQCKSERWTGNYEGEKLTPANCFKVSLRNLLRRCAHCDMERSYAAYILNTDCAAMFQKAYAPYKHQYQEYKRKIGTPTQYYDKKKKKWVRKPGVYRDNKEKYWVVPEFEHLAETGMFDDHLVKHSKGRRDG